MEQNSKITKGEIMNIDKKQLGTIFISAIFIISGISFAISWNPPSEEGEEATDVLKQPIANEQRLILIDNDITILTLFYLEDDEDSQGVKSEIERLNDEIGEKLLVEEIDARTYQSFSTEYNVKTIPLVLIRGKENINAPIRLEGSHDYSELKEKICTTYEEAPKFCD